MDLRDFLRSHPAHAQRNGEEKLRLALLLLTDSEAYGQRSTLWWRNSPRWPAATAGPRGHRRESFGGQDAGLRGCGVASRRACRSVTFAVSMTLRCTIEKGVSSWLYEEAWTGRCLCSAEP